MRTIEVVGAVIISEQKSILCALRSEKMSMSNHWEFPGGKIENGEDMKEALVREIREELGCHIRVKEKITDTYHRTEAIIVHLHTFLTEIIEGTPEPIEHEELRWVPIDELRQLNWAPADIPTVDWLQQELDR
ncbi:(deoxy)nucleoside triphosphate pyrophosphohydrolase [Alkalihalobacterium elongatum]|uniref:(deoxy)nucleoside triphosphate pyrophosphohydrolase n=1 Tax=Alkalihalobacterium elongatum TaxID=2675466 RepID=UPI001C1F8BEC|nr:(deoxy)nucleoside triphosphate pyrophosphohydrolase [Alkalihalobacterium elongatum]